MLVVQLRQKRATIKRNTYHPPIAKKNSNANFSRLNSNDQTLDLAIVFQSVSAKLGQENLGLAWPYQDLIESRVRFRTLLHSCKEIFRIDSTESRSILNHHRENSLAAFVYDGHPVEVNYATAH